MDWFDLISQLKWKVKINRLFKLRSISNNQPTNLKTDLTRHRAKPKSSKKMTRFQDMPAKEYP